MFPSLGILPLSYFKAQSDIKKILSRNSMKYIVSNDSGMKEEGSELTFLALLCMFWFGF